MEYKPMAERWKEEKASDFIVERPKIKLEPVNEKKPVQEKGK